MHTVYNLFYNHFSLNILWTSFCKIYVDILLYEWSMRLMFHKIYFFMEKIKMSPTKILIVLLLLIHSNFRVLTLRGVPGC